MVPDTILPARQTSDRRWSRRAHDTKLRATYVLYRASLASYATSSGHSGGGHDDGAVVAELVLASTGLTIHELCSARA